MIIFTHIPKTGGTSLISSLMSQYGERYLRVFTGGTACENPEPFLRLLRDYGYNKSRDHPQPYTTYNKFSMFYRRRKLKTHLKWLAAKYDILHGHFPTEQYLNLLPDAQSAIFFRRPESHLLSFYLHLCRIPKFDPNIEPAIKPLNYIVHKEKLSLAQFSAHPQVKGFFRYYVEPLRLNRYDFIGITEEYDLSIRLFNAIFGTSLQAYKHNSNPKRVIIDDLCLRSEKSFITYNMRDNQRLFDAAKRRFDFLCQRYL